MGVLDDDGRVATGLSVGRIGIGLGAVVAPRLTSRLFGFPTADVTPSAIVMARLFGVREAVLGATTLWWVRDHPPTRTVAGVNAAVDGADTVALTMSLFTGRRPLRAILGSLALSIPFAILWGRMASRAG